MYLSYEIPSTMSSKGDKAREKRKNRSLLGSGEQGQLEGSGAGGEGGVGADETPSEILIPLTQFDLVVLARARKGDLVEVRYQNDRYEVLLASARLGNVPQGSYEAKLRPHLVLSARLAQVSNDPASAKISVQANG